MMNFRMDLAHKQNFYHDSKSRTVYVWVYGKTLSKNCVKLSRLLWMFFGPRQARSTDPRKSIYSQQNGAFLIYYVVFNQIKQFYYYTDIVIS